MTGYAAAGRREVAGESVKQVVVRIAGQTAVTGVDLDRREDRGQFLIRVHRSLCPFVYYNYYSRLTNTNPTRQRGVSVIPSLTRRVGESVNKLTNPTRQRGVSVIPSLTRRVGESV